jgi:hypothetical protein
VAGDGDSSNSCSRSTSASNNGGVGSNPGPRPFGFLARTNSNSGSLSSSSPGPNPGSAAGKDAVVVTNYVDFLSTTVLNSNPVGSLLYGGGGDDGAKVRPVSSKEALAAWTPAEETLYRMFALTWRNNPCAISLMMATKTCQQVRNH